MMPSDLAFSGAFMRPSRIWEDALTKPILNSKRTVPPPPGKIPTSVSGKPTLAFGFDVQKIRWVANGNSKPIPAAVPGRADAIGLPPLLVFLSMPARSILRSNPCIRIVPSNRPLAGSSPASAFILASRFKSMPPANVSLPDVITIPLTASSAKASSI